MHGSRLHADDLACLTGNISDMKIQAEKVGLYSNWAYLQVSGSKTVVTGMARALAKAQRQDPAKLARAMLAGQIILQPAYNPDPIPFLPPDQPFRYLGVDITLTLNWRAQRQRMTEDLRKRLADIANCCLSTRQTIQLIRTSLVPRLAYAFPVVPCSPAVIARWDSIILSAIKRKWGFMQCAPTATMREDVCHGGMGLASLAVEYHSRNGSALIEALNEYGRQRGTDGLPGRYGAVTCAMLDAQLHHLQRYTHGGRIRLARKLESCLRVRQALSVHGVAAKIVKNNTDKWSTQLEQVAAALTGGTADPNPHLTRLSQAVCAAMLPLQEAGYNSPQSLLCGPGRALIMDHQALKKQGGRRVGIRQCRALHRLTALMRHADPPNEAHLTEAISRTRPWAAAERMVATAGGTPLCASWMQPILQEQHAAWRWAGDYRPPQLTLHECWAEADRRTSHPRPIPLPHAMQPAFRAPGQARAMAELSAHSILATPKRVRLVHLHTHRQRAVDRTCGQNWHTTPTPKTKEAAARFYDSLNQAADDMYGHCAEVDVVLASCTKKGKPHYTTRWTPTVMDRWALPLYERLGYEVTHVENVSRQQAAADGHTTCEICAVPGGNTRLCSLCFLLIHPACLENRCGTTEVAAAGGTWECPSCAAAGASSAKHMRKTRAPHL